MMHPRALRHAELVPPLAPGDAQRLRGLPSSWSARVAESAVDAIAKRAALVASSLAAKGERRGAEELRRTIALLGRAEALCLHAQNLEVLADLYAALMVLSPVELPRDHALEASRAWAQAATAWREPGARGPAVRATTEMRNRAFRLLASRVAREVSRATSSARPSPRP
jgi:hypothetical protein